MAQKIAMQVIKKEKCKDIYKIARQKISILYYFTYEKQYISTYTYSSLLITKKANYYLISKSVNSYQTC